MTATTKTRARIGARPAGNAEGWRPTRTRARTVGEFLPALMRPAFEKYGFSSAAILTDWAALAGPELAAYTAPERLKWPRKKPGEGKDGEPSGGATLILRVVGARALEVEHRRPQIIERLNASFGYRAVAEIRLVQAPLEKRDARPVPSQPSPSANPPAGLSEIREEKLREAIARLASGIETRRAMADIA
jgi:hypothetical protein